MTQMVFYVIGKFHVATYKDSETSSSTSEPGVIDLNMDYINSCLISVEKREEQEAPFVFLLLWGNF